MKLSPLQNALYVLMSDISEEHYCAGWNSGNEYCIWKALTSGDTRYGLGEIDADMLASVRALSDAIRGWIMWDEGPGPEDEPEDDYEGPGPRYIAMADWRKRVEWHQRHNPEFWKPREPEAEIAF